MSADYTPVFQPYSGQGSFLFWSQKVLPLVYDDSLSYYEVLCKVVNFLNNTIQDMDAVEANTDALRTAYDELQGYVNTYFDNLDIQTEINNKLDAMAEDGTLTELVGNFINQGMVDTAVSEQIGETVAGQIDGAVANQIDDVVAEQMPETIGDEVTAWLNENVDPVGSAVIVDNTLSITGAAADAKVTGDLIKKNKDDIKEYGAYYDRSKIGTANKTGSTVFISEKNPRNFNALPIGAILKKRNRFNINTASFTLSHASVTTLTKENGGIKLVCTSTNSGSVISATYAYTAEFTGTLFISCDSDIDVGDRVRSVGISANINGGSNLDISKGIGKLYIALPVEGGDTVNILFYCHINGTEPVTCYYKNIMIAYNGLYDYVPYASDGGTETIPTTKNLTITPEVAAAGTNASRAYSGGGYFTYFNNLIDDLYAFPPDIYTATTLVTCNLPEISIVPYHQVNQGKPSSGSSIIYPAYSFGVATASNKRCGLCIDSKTKGSLSDLESDTVVNWLRTHELILTYITGYESVEVEITSQNIQQGDILVFEADTNVTYNYEKEEPVNMVCFGDSITGAEDNLSNYPELIKFTSNINTVNAGFAGQCYVDNTIDAGKPFCLNRLIDSIVNDDWTYQDSSSYVDPESASYKPVYAEHLEALKAVDWEDIRYVTFFYGYNDWHQHAYITSESDPNTTNKQRTNVEDALKYSISQLLTKYPYLTIMVLCPYSGTEDNISTDTRPNSSGKYLYEYSDEIENVSKSYHLPVENLYYKYGNNFTTRWYFLRDEIHPGIRMKYLIANTIKKMVKEN